MTRRRRQRAGTWGTAANGCGARGASPAPVADTAPHRGHLNAERSDRAAPRGREAVAVAPRGWGAGRAGQGCTHTLPPRQPPGSRPPAERRRQERPGGCARPAEPTGRPLQGSPATLWPSSLLPPRLRRAHPCQLTEGGAGDRRTNDWTGVRGLRSPSAVLPQRRCRPSALGQGGGTAVWGVAGRSPRRRPGTGAEERREVQSPPPRPLCPCAPPPGSAVGRDGRWPVAEAAPGPSGTALSIDSTQHRGERTQPSAGRKDETKSLQKKFCETSASEKDGWKVTSPDTSPRRGYLLYFCSGRGVKMPVRLLAFRRDMAGTEGRRRTEAEVSPRPQPSQAVVLKEQ
ncbi:translation initiation factor IF-2-like [Vidua chalybeata]|uniref:translation initiation factor IF-2-like n=1 Tax=Vidua chalybeata TaxID=81927 RepID=UPI0023A85B53|nr:translation initiation factor IF-2-like [Vidua chalybeata]